MADGLSAEVKRLARAAGFDDCGITRPALDARDVDGLRRWVAAGMYADMAWMAEPERLARRSNPRSLLADVRSVICVGLRYTPPRAPTADGCGVISAYALGDDYHIVMKKRLKRLARALDRLLGAHDQRVFVDTAPVLEHALAASAGVGWQGKHSLTLNRDGGSWLLLGELFTTAELDCDPPASDHCGSCSACIDGCPTGAIVAPFVVDARRCISWLTIEYGGVIPRHLRPLIGNRVFGCDDCQLVCPWNRKASTVGSDLLRPRADNRAPPLRELLTLDAATFHARFRNTPVKRTGRARLVRNAAVAAGNSGDRSLVPALVRLLEEPEALIRLHAVWALIQLRDAENSTAIDAALRELRRREHDTAVLEEVARLR